MEKLILRNKFVSGSVAFVGGHSSRLSTNSCMAFVFFSFMAIITVLAGGLYATPEGVPLVNGLGGSAGFGENSLGRNDDGYSGSIDITSVFPDGLNFFGTVHTRLFVNNNGNITFNSGMSTYNPYGITGSTGNPIIAPFFDDIDTRAGVVTPSLGGTSTGSNLVYWDLDTENYIFTATWDDVGQYSSGKVPNAFQVRLHNRGGGNFDIELRYETINWSKNGARAGWSSGNGTNYYEFPQSGNNSLMVNMDSDVGVYWFSVRSGEVSDVLMYPEIVDFGDIEVGQTSVHRDVVVSNSRVDALNLTSMILTGDAASNYIISGFSQGQTVEPGGSRVYEIAFTPQSLGTKNGFVELSFVCGGEEDLLVSSLLGRGTGKILTVASDYGTASPTVGSHEFVPSAEVDASVGSPVVNGATRYVCTGWTGTGSVAADGAVANVSFVISEDSSITWNWATEYLLTANAQTGGNVEGNNQWYGSGAVANLTAVAISGYRFGEWSGDIDGCTIDGENIAVAMTLPRQITASFIELLPPVAVNEQAYHISVLSSQVVLDATGSYDLDNLEDGFDAIESLQWDLGNDGIEDDDGRINAFETITLAQAIAKGLAIGVDLPVSLTVYDLDGLTDTASTIITYANTAPSADAGSDYTTVAYGGDITLNGTADDADLGIGVGEVLVYEWATAAAASAGDFGNGFSNEMAPTLSHSVLLGLLGSQSGTLYFNVMDLSEQVASSSAEFSVEVPNVAISSPNIYGYAYAGKATTARYTVSNTGTCPVEGNWVDTVYLSDDGVIGGDLLVGTHSYSFTIGVGQSYNGEVSFTVPADTPEGQKWLIIKTNSTGTITETTADDNIMVAGAIQIRHVPKIQAMSNQTIVAYEPYVGEIPQLEQGTPPILWSAVLKPHTGSSVDAATGQFSWQEPLPRLEPYTVRIAAENDGGYDEKSWQLTVVRTPEITPIANYTTASGISFISAVPTLVEPTSVVWSLASAPDGVSINSATGRVSWASPVKEGSPHSVTIAAENLAGSDTEMFYINVIDKPVIAVISDDSVDEWTSYSRSDITLLSGGDTTVWWSLIDRPAGMVIDSQTAAISWSNTIPSSNSYLVRVRAQNDAGYDTKVFNLTVNASPVIAGVGNEAINGTTPYSHSMTLVRGSSPVAWSLLQSPAGMSINETTGVISWPSPVVSETAYTIIVGASNAIGSDSTQWNISVQQPPVINDIDDVLINEGQHFNLLPQLLGGTSPISWALVRAPSGLSINGQTGELDWQSAVAGGPYEVVIQALNNVGSDTKSFYIDVPILYTASISTDTVVATAGTAVTLSGNAYWIDGGAAAANVPVLIRIMLKNMRRTVDVVSDSLGNFSYTWTPFATEAGLYTIAADHPSVKNDFIQDEFNLYGLRLLPTGMRHGVNINELSSGSVSIRNLGDQQLTGISYTVNNAQTSAVELDLVSCPETLNGYGIGEIRYNILGLQTSQIPYTPSILINCDQGAVGLLNFEIMVSQQQAVLESNITSIDGAMVRGGQKFIELTLTNTGGSPTEAINVSIPQTEFMTLVTPVEMPALDVRQQATITVKLQPAEDAPLNVNTGSIAINAGNAGLSIPYNLVCVSDMTGTLKIEATDDYTYQTAEAPKLFGASVVITNPSDGTVVYNGVTDAGGEIVFTDVPEAYYSIEVKADKHGSFRSTVLAKGGETTLVSAFLPLNLVSYNWTVRPTQIEDHYTFTVQAVFETNVPAPVVTIEPALTDLETMEEAEIQINYTLTNNGLINAEETDLLFDAGNSNYEFIPLVDEIGVIPANSSIVVPVLIRDLTKIAPLTPEAIMRVQDIKVKDSKSLSCSVNVRSFVGYNWQCGPDRRWHKVPFYFKFPVLECTGGSTVSGGDNYDIYDGGTGGWTSDSSGSSNWGGGGWDWYVPPVYIPTGTSHNFATNASCNPCVDKAGKALLNCAISFMPLSCPVTAVKSSAECGSDCYSGSMWNCAKSCVGGLISSAANCGKDIAKKANPLGIAWNIFWCLYDLGDACLTSSSQDISIAGCCGSDINRMARTTVVLSELTGQDITINDTNIDYVLEEAGIQASRIRDVFDVYTTILGSEVWFSGSEDEDENEKLVNWLDYYSYAMSEESDSAEVIDPNESQLLLAMPLPNWVDIEDARYAIERWNNTVNYWQNGIGSVEDIPEGQDDNFVPFNEFKDASQLSALALEEQIAEGFTNLLEGESVAHENVKYEVENPTSGVCARVKIEIKQEAVISRNAFEAVLELSNDGQVDPLGNVRVTIQVVDSSGADKTDVFGIHPPQLKGIDDVSGSGNLAATKNCSVLWLIVPTQQAAPTEPVEYFVKGKLEYDFAGQQVLIPLYPAKISVMPNPNLQVHYFLEREVYSDDPFTDEVEPAIPFSLGLMMKNTGYGDAYNVQITSSQPEIIENEKGLLIDFEIIGTIVGTNAARPSLKVTLGDIKARESAVAQWIMLASLQGKFIDYSASFEHIDGLGNPQLSLVESVDIHETEKVVIADYPFDDRKPDFLVNDIYDTEKLPDTLYNSDGVEYPVEAIVDASVDRTATADNPVVVVSTPQDPNGWVYIRIDNPIPQEPQLTLESVIRSDGKQIISSNAWVTKKIEYKDEGNELKHYLHIFDYGGTGIYTATYAPNDQIKPVVVSVSADDVLDAGSDVNICITYSDDIAIDTLSIGNGDIYVSGSGGFYAEPLFVYTDQFGDGTPRTGCYNLAAPQNGWTTEHNGTYTITLATNQVRDTSYNYANSAVIGSFEVNIQPLEAPFMTLVSSQRITRTMYEYEYTLTVDNQTGKLFSDRLCRVFGLPQSAVIIRDMVVFDIIAPDESTVATTTIKFRLDLSESLDWNAIYFEYYDYIRGDIDNDGRVDIIDLEIMGINWLTNDSQSDVYPAPYGDGFVDFRDFIELAKGWFMY